MASHRITLSVPDSVPANLEAVAAHNHLDASKYAALIVSKFSDLRPEHGLDALAAIPKEYFRRGPGRPTTSASSAQVDRNVTSDNGR